VGKPILWFRFCHSYGAIYVVDNGHYLFTDIIEKCVLFVLTKYDMNGPKIKMKVVY